MLSTKPQVFDKPPRHLAAGDRGEVYQAAFGNESDPTWQS
jgi:hypothetical protein